MISTDKFCIPVKSSWEVKMDILYRETSDKIKLWMTPLDHGFMISRRYFPLSSIPVWNEFLKMWRERNAKTYSS